MPMIYPRLGPEFGDHLRDCVDVLKVINDILIKNQRNFDSAIVQTCLELIDREFLSPPPCDNVISFPAKGPQAPGDAAGDSGRP